MQLTLKDDLPFIDVIVVYSGREVEIANVLIDTGSASTILASHRVATIGIVPELEDALYTIRGVGSVETVFTRRIERLRVGAHAVADFEIEVGGMNYGFEINGILGMDFLRRTGAIINLRKLSLEFSL